MSADVTTHVPTLADQVLAEAKESRAGRAARNLMPGTGLPLTQTLLGMAEGTVLNEHENPGAATLHVLKGGVLLEAEGHRVELGTGDHTTIPQARHTVTSLEESVALLTVATSKG